MSIGTAVNTVRSLTIKHERTQSSVMSAETSRLFTGWRMRLKVRNHRKVCGIKNISALTAGVNRVLAMCKIFVKVGLVVMHSSPVNSQHIQIDRQHCEASL